MNELNPAGLTIIPYVCIEEECLGLNQLKNGKCMDTEYNLLFSKPQIQDALCTLLKTDDYKLIDLECKVINDEDIRCWTICSDPESETKTCKIILSIDDVNENEGAILWIPNSQRINTIPTNESFKTSYFTDKNTGKIYPMKKRFATSKGGDMIAIHPYCWYSLGLNTSGKDTRYLVATYSS